MKQRKRIYYNAQQRAIIWERYQQGDSLHDIAKFFDRFHSSIQGIIAKTGGIRPPDKTRAVLSGSLKSEMKFLAAYHHTYLFMKLQSSLRRKNDYVMAVQPPFL
jgi:hypothetical protein